MSERNMVVSTALSDGDGAALDRVQANRIVTQSWTVENKTGRPYDYVLWCTPKVGALRYPQSPEADQPAVKFEGRLGIKFTSETHLELIEYEPAGRTVPQRVGVDWELLRRTGGMPAFERHLQETVYVSCSV